MKDYKIMLMLRVMKSRNYSMKKQKNRNKKDAQNRRHLICNEDQK